MSRTALNLLLLAVVGGLGVAVWLVPPRHPPAAAAPVLLPALKPEAITRVRIQRPGEPDIALEKDRRGWRLNAPFQAPANDVRVAAVTALAGADRHGGFAAAGRDLKPFGLAPPAARVVLDDTAIELGDAEPLSTRRYVKVGGTIYLIPAYYTTDIAAPPAAFVSLALLPDGGRPVVITAPGIAVRRDPDGHWAATVPPGSGTATVTALDAFAARWRRARALDVEAADAGAKPSGTVTIELAGGARLAFEITARSPDLVLVRRGLGVAYHFPASKAGKLLHLVPPARPHDRPPPVG